MQDGFAVIVTDTNYFHLSRQLQVEFSQCSTVIPILTAEISSNPKCMSMAQFLPGRYIESRPDDPSVIFYIGNQPSLLMQMMLTYPQCTIISYDPLSRQVSSQNAMTKRVLTKRLAYLDFYIKIFFLLYSRLPAIEAIQRASIVGVLIGTLAAG